MPRPAPRAPFEERASLLMTLWLMWSLPNRGTAFAFVEVQPGSSAGATAPWNVAPPVATSDLQRLLRRPGPHDSRFPLPRTH
jgi:hypothetical protein